MIASRRVLDGLEFPFLVIQSDPEVVLRRDGATTQVDIFCHSIISMIIWKHIAVEMRKFGTGKVCQNLRGSFRSSTNTFLASRRFIYFLELGPRIQVLTPEDPLGLSVAERGCFYAAASNSTLNARYTLIGKLEWGHTSAWLSQDGVGACYVEVPV